MKTYKKTFLPEEITYKGETYRLEAAASSLMITEGLAKTVNDLENKGKKLIKVEVLSKNLKGKTDLHGNLYTPSVFVFSTKKLKKLKDFDLTKKDWIEQNHFGDFLLYEENENNERYRLWKNHPENVKQGEPRFALEYFGEKNGYNWEKIDEKK